MNWSISSDWRLANYRYMTAAVSALCDRLNCYIASQKNQLAVELPNTQAALVAMEASMPALSALSKLCNLLNLSLFERDVLLMCVGVNISPHFSSLCVQATGEPYPTFALALEILPGASWSAYSTQSPLHYWQLIEMRDGLVPALCPLQIDKSILCYLMGEPYFDDKLFCIDKVEPTAEINYSLQPSHQEIAERLANIWLSAGDLAAAPTIQLCSEDVIPSQSIAKAASEIAGCKLYVMKAHRLTTNPNDLNQFLRRWQREALLNNSVLLLDCYEVNTADVAKLSAIEQLLEGINSRLIITSGSRLGLSQHSAIAFDVPKLTVSEQLAIWQDTLATKAPLVNTHIQTLVDRFHLTQPAIISACNKALLIVNTDSTKQTDSNRLAIALWDSCRTIARTQLDQLAFRIDSTATWDDLVLPEAQKQTLREMVAHVQQRQQVYENWGFASKGRRGLGISALFAGASGTGKTFSAEVVANELRLDLYRIDLSTVVSKYIGETEKNLRRIFDAAEAGGAVLLFDEADALFGKRSDVRDSHDRYANMEVAYLLQRIEAYQGLAILTTNLKDSIDTAFLRRIRFIVKYAFPDTKEREAIWRCVFPKQTPTDSLDYTKLARLNMAGGNIRNIALNAAFLAASASEPVMMKHILQATQSESLKLGYSLSNTEIRGWVENTAALTH